MSNIREVFARQLGVEAENVVPLLRDSVFPDASPADIMVGLVLAARYQLDPFAGEIDLIRDKGGRIKPFVNHKGWSKVANRPSNNMTGWTFDDVEHERYGHGVKCTIWRSDRDKPCEVTEYHSECVVPNSKAWQKTPSRMLRHRAWCQCCVLTFGTTGVLDADEVQWMAENKQLATPDVPFEVIPQPHLKSKLEDTVADHIPIVTADWRKDAARVHKVAAGWDEETATPTGDQEPVPKAPELSQASGCEPAPDSGAPPLLMTTQQRKKIMATVKELEWYTDETFHTLLFQKFKVLSLTALTKDEASALIDLLSEAPGEAEVLMKGDE